MSTENTSMNWKEQGCEKCRHAVYSGSLREVLRKIADGDHQTLYTCPFCNVYWEENEREAHVVSEEQAQTDFPKYFVKK